jgi:thioredoxin 2
MSTTLSDERGLIVTCPSCRQNNRLRYERLEAQPRCAKCGTALTLPADPIDVADEATFNALTGRSALPVLVDFWAEWCGPCKMVAPEVKKVAAEGPGRWLIAKVNTEELPSPSQQFQIRGIPTFVLFQHGREVARQSGAMPATALREFILQHLNHPAAGGGRR